MVPQLSWIEQRPSKAWVLRSNRSGITGSDYFGNRFFVIYSYKIIIPKKEESLNTESIEDTNESDINVQEKININTATKDELTSLNGIGEATANKIINYRNKNKFKEIEDIMNVPGIGEAKFNNIKDYICV